MSVKQRATRPLAAAAAAAALAACVELAVVVTPEPVALAAGPFGGVYYPVGNAICRLYNLERRPGAAFCVAEPSEGALANIERLRSGEAMLGLAQSGVAYAAFHGEGPFAPSGADAELRALVALSAEAVTILAPANSDIRESADLEGKRVGVGVRGTGYAVTRDLVLRHYGWTPADFPELVETKLSEQVRMLCEGAVDAVVLIVGHPNGFTQEAKASCGARLVPATGPPVERLLAAEPWFIRVVIPGGLYADEPDAVPTFGTRALLLASARLPDRLAYAVARALLADFDDFRRLHPVLFPLRREDLLPSAGAIPLHPGARRAFDEAGLTAPE